MKLKKILLIFALGLTVQISEAQQIQINNPFDIELISKTPSGTGSDNSDKPSISSDGRYVVFGSSVDNLILGVLGYQVYLKDRDSDNIELISQSTSGEAGGCASIDSYVSDNGRYVVFVSCADNLVPNDNNGTFDIFLRDRLTQTTERISVSSNGEEANDTSRSRDSFRRNTPTVSNDGRYVAFTSSASNLIANGNSSDSVFLRDRQSGTTTQINQTLDGQPSEFFSKYASLSRNGQYVVFASRDNNLVQNNNNNRDVFVYDIVNDSIESVSVSTSGEQADRSSSWVLPSISADGRFVAFYTNSTILDGGGVVVRDRLLGTTKSVLRPEVVNVINIEAISISDDGRFVLFNSGNRIAVDDTNVRRDVYVHDQVTGISERINYTDRGFGDVDQSYSMISGNGKYVVLETNDSYVNEGNRVGGDDVYLLDVSPLRSASDLSVTVTPTTGITAVGDYIRFRARFKNTGNQSFINCKAQIVDPYFRPYERKFNFYTRPLNTPNPSLNKAIDIEPGQTAQMVLAVQPREAMSREVKFKFSCDNVIPATIPLINSVYLTAKTEPFIAEDFVQLANYKSKKSLVINRNRTRYWTPYIIEVNNTGIDSTSVNLTTTSTIPADMLRQSQLCEPIDPLNNTDWSCSSPSDTQIQVDLNAGQTKKIVVFVHAKKVINKQPAANQVFVEASDQAGKTVARNSISVFTKN